MPRLFVAIDLPPERAERLARVRERLRGARWTPAEQLHLTLRFIGEVGADEAETLRTTLAAVGGPPLQLVLRGLGRFPPRGRPRIVWAGLESSEPLSRLQRAVERALQRWGAAPERKQLHPHVTLARLDGAHPGEVEAFLARHARLGIGPFPIDAFHLYSSVLSPAGATHELLESYALKATQGGD